MLRHGRMGVAQVVAVAAIAVGALAAIYAERSTVREGFVALRYVRVGWLLAAFSVELVSMVALAQLERSLLRGAGAKHTLRSVLATAYSSNAISVTVPIIGSSLATAYAYRDFRRGGARPEHVSMALTVAGVFSTVAFAVVAATGALITGNPAAAAASLVASFLLAAAVAAIVVALRFPRLHGKYSVAAVLVYRGMSLKGLITVAFLIYHRMVGRRRGYAPESAPPSRRSTAPLTPTVGLVDV